MSRGVRVAERLHDAVGPSRRIRVLCDHLEPWIPRGASLLDVGCGDGALAAEIGRRRPDLALRGIDVLVRERAGIPVDPFDGRTIPHADQSFDHSLLADVLHHSDDPERLLAEAARVARQGVLVKDHTLSGWLAGPTLRFMDDVGNRRFGVALPHDYWPEPQWHDVFDRLGLRVVSWVADLHLYPAPLDWIFGRSLHFVAELRPR